MEGLHCLKFLLKQYNLLWKIHLKEVYFSFSLNKKSQHLPDFNGQATYTNFFVNVLDSGQLQEFWKSY